jgi:cell division protein FtsB
MATSSRSRTAPRPAGPSAGLAAVALRVRWDRVGRVALLCVLGLVLLLYVGPAHAWIKTWRESHTRRTQVQTLQREHARLLARRKALQNPRTMVEQARALGMVKPTERSYVISGLPGDK